MASKENKIIRRAQSLSELSRLSGLLAEHLEIEVPDVQITNRDPELAEIQRLDSINALLTQVLQASDVETAPETFKGMTKAELLEKAAELKIEVTKSSTKAQIIEALEAHGANQ